MALFKDFSATFSTECFAKNRADIRRFREEGGSFKKTAGRFHVNVVSGENDPELVKMGKVASLPQSSPCLSALTRGLELPQVIYMRWVEDSDVHAVEGGQAQWDQQNGAFMEGYHLNTDAHSPPRPGKGPSSRSITKNKIDIAPFTTPYHRTTSFISPSRESSPSSWSATSADEVDWLLEAERTPSPGPPSSTASFLTVADPIEPVGANGNVINSPEKHKLLEVALSSISDSITQGARQDDINPESESSKDHSSQQRSESPTPRVPITLRSGHRVGPQEPDTNTPPQSNTPDATRRAEVKIGGSLVRETSNKRVLRTRSGKL
ncbi:hypothetical protein DL93DRAFT_2167100 [Clavulina sp. PMI_390]|nr:hypothetical protein DL93DRAFT_2167100 [Clavulina sp. PMI_390]